MINVLFSQDRRIRGLNRGENFTPTVVEAPSTLPFETADLTLFDMNYKADRLEYTINDFRVDIVAGSLGDAHTYSLDERTVADVSIDQSGNVISALDENGSQIAGGDVYVRMDSRDAGSKILMNRIAPLARTIVNTILSYEVGSLSEHASNQMDALILGKIEGATTQEYWQSNNSNVNAPVATLNPDRFVSSIDLSALSAMRTGQTQDKFPVSLISPNHAITTTHTTTAVGQKLVFMLADTSFAIVTVDAVSVLGDDLSIAYFSTPVIGVTPFKVMATDWEMYAPTLRDAITIGIPRLPILSKRYNDPLGADVSWMAIAAIHRLYLQIVHKDAPPVFGDTLAWYNEATGGDSGSPIFMVVNGEPILITHHTTVDQGTDFAARAIEINTAMNDLAGTAQGTYALVHPDLTEFNTYPA